MPELWRVRLNFYAVIVLRITIHSSKNYSLIFLHAFPLISSIILATNTPRMMNQSVLLTHQFLLFIPTIQLTFPKYFYIFLIFYATPRFSPQRRAQDIPKGRRPRTTNDPEFEPEGPKLPQTRRSWQAAPAVPGAQTTSTPRTAEPTAAG